MSTWAEIHGEENEGNARIPRSDEIWCDSCDCYILLYDLKQWSGDGMQHYLCPGCDTDLLDPDLIEENIPEPRTYEHGDSPNTDDMPFSGWVPNEADLPD